MALMEKFFLVNRLSDQKMVALKVSIRSSENDIQEFIREAALMTSIEDDSVLSCIDAYQWDNRVWLFMPFMDAGKLTTIFLDRLKCRLSRLS